MNKGCNELTTREIARLAVQVGERALTGLATCALIAFWAYVGGQLLGSAIVGWLFYR